MSGHTPTPWEANKQWLYAADGKGNTTRTVPVASGQAEWVTADGGPLRDEAAANAAFIVKAVNSHAANEAKIEALEAALSHACDALDHAAKDSCLDEVDGFMPTSVALKARAAIAIIAALRTAAGEK